MKGKEDGKKKGKLKSGAATQTRVWLPPTKQIGWRAQATLRVAECGSTPKESFQFILRFGIKMLLLHVGIVLSTRSASWERDSSAEYSYARPLGVSGPLDVSTTFGTFSRFS